MRRCEIIVLNDLHPNEAPGAATIALNFASEISKFYLTEFWHITLSKSYREKIGNITIRGFRQNAILENFRKRNQLVNLVYEFFSPFILIKLVLNLAILRPKVVWINQIGNRIPRIIVIALWLLRIETLQTFHDFTIIAPRKLYPENVKSTYFQLSENYLFDFIYHLRMVLLVFSTKLNRHNICISQLQKELYEQAGVRNLTVIANGIFPCSCINLLYPEESKEMYILFAGRSMGKGFSQLCKLVDSNPEWKLLIAGDKNLEVYAKQFLNSSRFEYLGFLNSRKLFEVMHKCTFVAILSECFDVYPTVALEGLMHGCSILISKTTGITDLMQYSKKIQIVDINYQKIDLTALSLALSKEEKFPVSQILIEKYLFLYKSLMDNIIK